MTGYESMVPSGTHILLSSPCLTIWCATHIQGI